VEAGEHLQFVDAELVVAAANLMDGELVHTRVGDLLDLPQVAVEVRTTREGFGHHTLAHRRGRLLDELGGGQNQGAACDGNTRTLHSRCAVFPAAASSVPYQTFKPAWTGFWPPTSERNAATCVTLRRQQDVAVAVA